MKKVKESKQIKDKSPPCRNKWGKRSKPFKEYLDLARWIYLQDISNSEWLLKYYEISDINLEENTVIMSYKREHRSGEESKLDINKTVEKLFDDIDFTIWHLRKFLYIFMKTALGQSLRRSLLQKQPT